MSVTLRESSFYEGAIDTGLADIAGGVATVVLAICGLTGIHPPVLTSIATIVFGAALVAQGGMVLSGLSIAARDPVAAADIGGYGGSVAILLMAGLGGVILGVLALLGINPTVLTAVSVIAYGAALVLSSGAGWALHVRARELERGAGITRIGGGRHSAESVQTIAGFAVLTLGILGLVIFGGEGSKLTLVLTSLLILGSALSIVGGGLGAMAQKLVRQE